jgi:putative membrane protein
MHHLIHVIVVALAVLVTARIVPGIRVRGLVSAVVFAIVLGLLNIFARPILIFFGFPFVLVTLGLFLLVINAFLFWLADKIVAGVEVDGFGSAFLGSLCTSLVSWGIMYVLNHL